MPIQNGQYVAPTWNNNAPPAIDATEMQAISDTIVQNQNDLNSVFSVLDTWKVWVLMKSQSVQFPSNVDPQIHVLLFGGGGGAGTVSGIYTGNSGGGGGGHMQEFDYTISPGSSYSLVIGAGGGPGANGGKSTFLGKTANGGSFGTKNGGDGGSGGGGGVGGAGGNGSYGGGGGGAKYTTLYGPGGNGGTYGGGGGGAQANGGSGGTNGGDGGGANNSRTAQAGTDVDNKNTKFSDWFIILSNKVAGISAPGNSTTTSGGGGGGYGGSGGNAGFYYESNSATYYSGGGGGGYGCNGGNGSASWVCGGGGGGYGSNGGDGISGGGGGGGCFNFGARGGTTADADPSADGVTSPGYGEHGVCVIFYKEVTG